MQRVQNGVAYVHTFLNVLRNVYKEETVEYTIALLHELLSGEVLTGWKFQDAKILQ